MVSLQCNNCVFHTRALQRRASRNGALYESIFLVIILPVTWQVIDDWQYASLVMDRFLMYIYMIVTVVGTCSILIRTSVLQSFDQQAFKAEIAHERSCKDDSIDYTADCNDWYPKICVDENNQLHPYVIANPGWKMLQTCKDYISLVLGG